MPRTSRLLKTLRHRDEARFLYTLEHELLRHLYNLQRALDGKSVFYVPTTTQQANITLEQTRLESMLVGVHALTGVWGVVPKPGREVPAKKLYALTKSAHALSAKRLKENQTAPNTYAGYAAEDIMGLEDLLHYLDAKACLYTALGQECPSYASLSEEIGYVQRKQNGSDPELPKLSEL